MKLKCQCCGIEAEFADGEAAFLGGWDAPPHFNTHVCCNLCPAVCIILGLSHAKAHELWEKEGRPAEFTVERCGPDDSIGSTEFDRMLESAAKSLKSEVN